MNELRQLCQRVVISVYVHSNKCESCLFRCQEKPVSCLRSSGSGVDPTELLKTRLTIVESNSARELSRRMNKKQHLRTLLISTVFKHPNTHLLIRRIITFSPEIREENFEKNPSKRGVDNEYIAP